MSVAITQHPSSVSLAGNPVLLKASSNLSAKTFLKVCAEVTVTLYLRSVEQSSSAYLLSIPTEGGSEVTFDFSEILSSVLSQILVERNAALAGGTASYTSGYVVYSVDVWDEYLDEYSEIVSTKSTASQSAAKYAIPGTHTDMQRLTLPEDTASWLGSAHILSRKPDFEAVPAGGKVTVPVYSEEAGQINNYLDSSSGTSLGLHSMYGNSVAWKTFTIPDSTSEGAHSIIWNGLDVPPFFIYVVPAQPFARYFEFVNRWGAVESIYAYGRAQRKNTITQERQVKRVNTSFRPSTRYVKRTLQEEETLQLSTGPVNRKWAAWFASEFLVAETAWMYSEAASDMVPVIIEADEAISVYNESEAEVLDLPFTVTMCING